MAFISYKNKLFVSSDSIRVFPCAYRGYYDVEGDNVTAQVFDPEARATTEANFANTFHKVGVNKPSYVVSWTAGAADNGSTLKCVIDGYYFEIKNCNIDDFFKTDSNSNKIPLALCIQTNNIDLSSSNLDSNRQTKILKALTEDAEYLDVQVEGGKYIFNGLCLIPYTEVDEAYKSLVPFRYRDTGEKDEDNESIYVQELDPAQLAITDLLDTGTGKYSIKVISNLEGGTSNSTNASGDYSVAFGKRTKATGNFSSVVGNKSEATGESSFAFGEESEAQGKGSIAGGIKAIAANQGSVAFGDNVTTNADNQVVIGKYNQTDNTKAFIIANGTGSNKSNKFTVSYQGDINTEGSLIVAANKATTLGGTLTVADTKKTTLGGELEVKGIANLQNTLTVTGNTEIGGTLEVDGATTLNSTLETKGNISATGTNSNDLVLGTNISGSYGSISVYGELDAKVFEVTKEGVTSIAGTVEITNNTQASAENKGALHVAGGATVDGNLFAGSTRIAGLHTDNGATITTDATIGGTLGITGKTTLSTLEASGDVLIKSETDAGDTSGALVVSGGTKVSKKLSVGSDLTVGGDAALDGTLEVAETVSIGDDLSINGDLFSTGSIILKNETAACAHNIALGSTTYNDYGTLIIYGKAESSKFFEVDANGNSTVHNNLTVNGITDASSSTSGALIVSGGAGINKQLRVGGNTTISGSTTINKDLTITGDDVTNTLTLGSNKASNLGGTLVIYGSGTSTVFEVATNGDTTISNDLTVGNKLSVDGNTEITGTLTVDNDNVEISAEGIFGINNLTVSGKVEAACFNATSDIRKKCNIEDFTSSKSILDLPIKQFEYINDSSHKKYIGCIAQDLQKIYPELVDTDSEGYLSIQESKLVYLLIKEIKELKEQVKRLQEE